MRTEPSIYLDRGEIDLNQGTTTNESIGCERRNSNSLKRFPQKSSRLFCDLFRILALGPHTQGEGTV